MMTTTRTARHFVNKVAGVAEQLSRSRTVVVSLSSTTARTSTSLAAAAVQQRYLLKYEYIPNVLEKRGPFREKHLELAKQMIAEGKCLSGGPTTPVGVVVDHPETATTATAATPPAPTGALFIFNDKLAAKQFVDQDPYVSNGIVTGHVIEEWNIVVQKES
jgi:uncharacterized protein